MKRKIIITMLSFSSLLLTAQETASSAGEEVSNSQVNINFTIGEPIINTLNSSNSTILSGYQQPQLKVKPISIEEGQDWQISVFPNPSTNYVNIEWNTTNVKELNYSLLDINGRIIKQGSQIEKITLDVTDISSGNYFLHLKSNKNQSQIYKIQKIK